MKEDYKMNWDAIKYSAANHQNWLMLKIGAAVLAMAVAFGCWMGQGAAVTAFAVAILFALAGALYASSYFHYLDAVSTNQRASLETWVADASTEEERARRLALVDELESGGIGDVTAFFADHDIEMFQPAVNVDGTPMLLGGIVDAHGNAFGTHEITVAAHNDTTGAWVSPNEAYESPIGM